MNRLYLFVQLAEPQNYCAVNLLNDKLVVFYSLETTGYKVLYLDNHMWTWRIGAHQTNIISKNLLDIITGQATETLKNSIQSTNWFVRNILILLCFVFSSRLICYDFVSSSTLLDFLCEKGTVLNFDTMCAIACDVISAIERLQDLGILHNNIKASNILIGQFPRVSKRFLFFPKSVVNIYNIFLGCKTTQKKLSNTIYRIKSRNHTVRGDKIIIKALLQVLGLRFPHLQISFEF